MTTTSRLRSGKAQLAAGAAVLALAGSGLALTSGGSAAADGDEWPNGWSTSVVEPARGGTQAGGAGETIRLRERSLREAEVDVDGDGNFDPGDSFLFESRLLDAQTHDIVGRDAAECGRVIRQFTCEGTFLLNDRGKIEVDGTAFRGERGFVLAVTGGTGDFRDAAGTLSVVGSSSGDVLVIQLAG